MTVRFPFLQKSRQVFLLLFLAGAVSACNGLSDGGKVQSNRPPDDLRYSTNPARYPMGFEIATNQLSSGAPVKDLSISPALPPGLTFDTVTGNITGTPTQLSPAQTYTVKGTNSNGTGYVQLSLAVTHLPPTMTYGLSTIPAYTVGTPISTITPTLGGDPTTSCTVSPALPAGLSLSSQCVLSGTPSAAVSATNYTISANNDGGSATITLNLTVNDVAPNISYSSGSFTLYRSQSVSVAATNTGGAIVSCASSPTLPSGLSLSSTCRISGTPSSLSSSTSYTITATNSGGTSTKALSLAVVEPLPLISYSPNSAVLKVGTAMTAMTAISSGGSIVSCSCPGLPTGLSISSSCQITGTPTAVTALNTYTVTATNATGSSTANVTLTVNDNATSLSYTGSPFVFTKGTGISTITPVSPGGTPTTCGSSPSLPSGLNLSTSCVITGTPTVVAAAQNYTITANNSGGSSSAVINVTVNDVAPNLTYAGTPYTFTKSTSVGTITPTNTGGTVTSCTVNPSLPAGLSLSGTCAISGTPTNVTASSTYTVTATNSGGTRNVVINITVKDTLPVFSYSGSPYTYTRNAAITTATPTNTGGTITSCAASPTLPSGLSLSTTCALSGTPTVSSAQTTYTITGTNSAGTASTSIQIKVNETVPVISYSGSPFTFGMGSAIPTLTPVNTGGTATSCSPSPSLPTGLSLSSTCVITGTPTAVTSNASYTITATNAAGSGSTTISIAVNDTAPAINYIPTTYNFTYSKGTAITALTPNNTGGTITGCTASPTLPAGLSIAATTCSITGTPTSVTAATSYTIAATNTGGTSTAVVTITVNDDQPSISYSGSPYSYTVGTAISSATPSNSGGTITSCSISPSLPAGLSISNLCVITGTPTAVSGSTAYTVTASNSGGASSVNVQIAVKDLVPTLSYSGPYTYTKGVAITATAPSTGGGAITSCSSSPTLPAGLTLSSACVISGTASVTASATTYTITASNSGGTGTATVDITVSDGPPLISYSGSPFTFVKSTPISTLSPTNTGGSVTSCVSVPTLPTGLSLSNTCVITGTPTVTVAAQDYTVTGTNSFGSSAAIINMTVSDSVPSIAYNAGTYIETLRTAISAITPSSNGGAVTTCSSSPALPAGLSISSTCVITGTPTVSSSATPYTITASNTTGSASTTLTIQVKNLAQVLFYGYTALDGSADGSIPSSQNIWKVSVDGIDRTALTQNSSGAANSGTYDSIGPSFSPDGSSVLYSSLQDLNGTPNGSPSGSANIWVAGSDGSSALALTTNSSSSRDSDQAPSYSNDGTLVVFSSKMNVNGTMNGSAASSYNIFVMNSDGTGLKALTRNTSGGLDSIQPVFAPNNNSLVYFASKTAQSGSFNGSATSSYNIWKVKTDGTGLTHLTSETSTSRDCIQPAVSGDGSLVAYASRSRIGGTTANSYNIWTINAGGTKTSLTSNTSSGLDSQYPRFSPDGTQIVFASKMNIFGSNSGSYNIWKMTYAGGSQTPLTQNTDSSDSADSITPVYSSDGSKLIFASLMPLTGSTPTNSFNIWIMNPDGSGTKALTTNTYANRDSFLGSGIVWFSP